MSTVTQTPIQAIPRAGSYSRLLDFGTANKPSKLITRGSKQVGATVQVVYGSNVSCGSSALDNSQTIANTGYTGANAQTLSLGTNRTLARCFFLRYTIDDSQSGIFPDSGNATSLTDYDVYFIANPASRLKGGRTFTDGLDRGLDAQP